MSTSAKIKPMTVISTLRAITTKEATRAAAMLDSAETDVIAKVCVLFLNVKCQLWLYYMRVSRWSGGP